MPAFAHANIGVSRSVYMLASGMTEAADQVDELLRMVGVEGNDELLVVNAVAVAGVGADALERLRGVNVSVHNPLA